MPNGISLSCCATRGAARRKPSSRRTATISARARRSTSTRCSTTFDADALGTSRHSRRIRVSHLAVLSRLSVLLLAPAAALVAAAASGEPLLAHWTETFMGGAAKFLAQFFPLFLLGALFGKLMDDSCSVGMTEKLGTARGILAVALAGAIVTYGGVSLFVAFFVLVPMAQSLFKAADMPTRLVPPACVRAWHRPALRHRVAVMSAGTLDSLPHNGAVVTLLAVCGVTHRDSRRHRLGFDLRVFLIYGRCRCLPIPKPTPCSPFARRSSLQRRSISPGPSLHLWPSPFSWSPSSGRCSGRWKRSSRKPWHCC